MEKEGDLLINMQLVIGKTWDTTSSKLVGVKLYLDEKTLRKVFWMFWKEAMAAGLTLKGL